MKQYDMLRLFALFIRDSKNGKRKQRNGNRIKSQTALNYEFTLNPESAIEILLQSKTASSLNSRFLKGTFSSTFLQNGNPGLLRFSTSYLIPITNSGLKLLSQYQTSTAAPLRVRHMGGLGKNEHNKDETYYSDGFYYKYQTNKYQWYKVSDGSQVIIKKVKGENKIEENPYISLTCKWAAEIVGTPYFVSWVSIFGNAKANSANPFNK